MVRYFMVIDLEATCVYPRQHDWQPEIIEIGAIILDSKLNEISEFQEFVQPVVNSTLSSFCLDLTKITQANVDRADTFPDVYERMLTWMRSNGLNTTSRSGNFTLVTDGIFDCNQYIQHQCKLCKLEYPEWAKSFSNIKSHFMYVLRARKANGRTHSMSEMTEKLGIEMDGQLHRALDDAKIIVKIMKGIRGRRPGFPFNTNATYRPDWTLRFFDD